MRNLLSVVLAVIILGTVPAFAETEGNKGQDEMIETSFYELTYSIPASWSIDYEDDTTVDYIPYASGLNGTVMFSEQEIDLCLGSKLEWLEHFISIIYGEDSANIDDVSEVESIEVDGVSGLRVGYTQEWNNARAVGWMYVFATDTRAYGVSWVIIPSRAEELQSTMERIISEFKFSENQADTTIPDDFDEEKVISQLDVKELHYNDIWDYDFLIVKNNSGFDLDLSVDVVYYDENDKIIGVTSDSESAVESGYPIVFWFMPDEEYSRVEYTFSAEEEDWYEPVISDLSYEESVTDSKVILSVTNNGDEPADFVEGTVLFYNGGNLVDFDWTYFTDDDSELKPGKTIIKEFDSYEDFDSYEVYFSGRRGFF